MKIEIRHLPPHQNAKVVAVILTLSTLLFALPFMLLMGPMGPHGAAVPWGMVLAIPVIYLVLGYVMTLVACVAYNVIVQFTGGLTFSTDAADD